MRGYLLFKSLLLFICTLLFCDAALGQDAASDGCIKCHEDSYLRAIANPYIHSIVKDKCALCHIKQAQDDQKKKIMRFSTLQTENILYLGVIEEGKKYNLGIVAVDDANRKSEPVSMEIVPADLWKFRGTQQPVKQISGVTVEEVKKGAFVTAVISWVTDGFGTSEIDYILTGRYPSRYTVSDIYSRKHRIILNGLKHKSTYRFNVISRDINGSVLKSDEHVIDTSTEFSHLTDPGENSASIPNIDFMRVFKIEGKEGLYLKISTNKRSALQVSLGALNTTADEKHGSGLTDDRFSQIEVCYKCHPQDASHPVGIKIEGPKVIMPDDLPTIEDGVLTCVTCHTAHGGDKYFFARVDFKKGKGICIKCHVKYFRED